MDKKQILLVEGNDDFHVFANIFKKYKVPQSFDIKDRKGIDNIIASLPIEVKTDLRTLGIVVDADVDIQQRWQSLKDILQNIGYNLPTKPNELGTIITDENLPKFGIWLMPNNQENGILEDFISLLVPEDDKLMPYVEEILSKIEENNLQKYKSVHKSKAKIHTWLAWQEKPGTPLGSAINQSYLNTNHQLCAVFIDWINRLYN